MKKGFTLIELIVVMAILAILVTMAAPKFLGQTKEAMATAVRADAKVIEDAAMLYSLENDDVKAITETNLAEAVDASTFTQSEADALREAINADLGIVDTNDDESTLDETGSITESSLMVVDSAKLSTYIKSTRNDIDGFVMVVGGPLDGTVYKVVPQADRNNVPVFR